MLVGGYKSLAFLVIVLVAASAIDIKQNRIPNALSALTATYGVAIHLYAGLGVLSPLAGMAVGLVIFLPFYIGGGMGAGDVKLMSAIGSILGLKVAIAAGITLVLGSFLGLFMLLKQPEGRAVFRNFAHALFSRFGWGAGDFEKPRIDHVMARPFPYAIAISVGTLITAGLLIPTG